MHYNVFVPTRLFSPLISRYNGVLNATVRFLVPAISMGGGTDFLRLFVALVRRYWYLYRSLYRHMTSDRTVLLVVLAIVFQNEFFEPENSNGAARQA